MGPKKSVVQENGVQLRYHRIVTLLQHVNVQTIIEVASYTSQAKRNEEKAADAANMEAGEVVVACDAYTSTSLYNLDYDPDMTIPKAYAYLKAQPEFEGAEDALDE